MPVAADDEGRGRPGREAAGQRPDERILPAAGDGGGGAVGGSAERGQVAAEAGERRIIGPAEHAQRPGGDEAGDPQDDGRGLAGQQVPDIGDGTQVEEGDAAALVGDGEGGAAGKARLGPHESSERAGSVPGTRSQDIGASIGSGPEEGGTAGVDAGEAACSPSRTIPGESARKAADALPAIVCDIAGMGPKVSRALPPSS